MNCVEEAFIKREVVRMMPSGNWFVMNKRISLEFIAACKAGSIEILGIDCFYLQDDGGIEPSMANSINFSKISKIEPKKDTYESSRQFVLSREDTMYFEIVCDV